MSEEELVSIVDKSFGTVEGYAALYHKGRADAIEEFVCLFRLEWFSRYTDVVKTEPIKGIEFVCTMTDFIDMVAKRVRERNYET